MSEQLQPFTSPTALLSYFPNGFLSGTLVTWALYAVFAFWALYSLVAIYHWLRYSHASWVTFPAIAAHLLVSIALMSYTLGGSAYFLLPLLP